MQPRPPREAGLATGHSLDVDAVSHRFGAVPALRDVTLGIRPGELVALLGPSGCGKTTLLRIIAGFQQQTAGSILVDGAAIDPLPPHRRDIGIVFQNYALFPHMTVAENVLYGLKARGRGRAAEPRMRAMLEMVQLGAFAGRLPRQLSGGQQQRVALARALAVEPRILLLDEPFGALDKGLRLDMQIEVKRLQRKIGLTTILVTHDQEEAMGLADRIAVLNQGRVEQFDAPTTVYDQPVTRFVNGFVGSTNLLPARLVRREGGVIELRLDAGATIRTAASGLVGDAEVGDAVLLSVRPEHLRLFDLAAEGRWPVTVELSLPLGGTVVHEAAASDGTVLKMVETRLGAAGTAASFCGIADGAPLSVFLKQPAAAE